MTNIKILALILCMPFLSCSSQPNPTNPAVKTGAENLNAYVHILEGKKIGVVANQSSLVAQSHLVDTLLALKMDVVKIFSPEHGFRGKADAGELIKDNQDIKTGLPVASLYGKNKKPDSSQLAGMDLIVFDLQDVGVRFFTYISTLAYMVKACADYNIPMLILDRPNPNGFYVDGPVLEMEHKSFVGMFPIPVVHGLTMGELALMMVGEGWINSNVKPSIQVIKCLDYDHSMKYVLPVKPSPNLPEMRSIYLYPSTCFFEGTLVSEGRGTFEPFQVYGHPDFKHFDTVFTPVGMDGASKNPKFKEITCKGFSLTKLPMGEIQQFSLGYLINAYHAMDQKAGFFNSYFTLLAGNTWLQQYIESGKSEADITERWQHDLNEYKSIRKKYLLYPDFTPLN